MTGINGATEGTENTERLSLFSKTSVFSVAKNALTRPVSSRPLVVLRVAFGLLMTASMVRFMARGWVTELYVLPQFHFTFWGFEWIRPLPPTGMWLVFILLALLGLTIAAGLATRPSLITFFLLFTYVELIDKAYYLNHYYFVSLLTSLLIFLPVRGDWSVDGRFGWGPPQPFVPAWMLWLVRGQLGLVYFFAGVAKLNPDWLVAAQPLSIWLHARTSTPLLGPLFDTAWMPYLFSWAGMLFDLTVPFWLSWRKSRGVAYLAVIVFHGLTGLLFNIGMFPWIMIACTLVFFDWRLPGQPAPSSKVAKSPRWVVGFLALFLGIQLLLPLRHWLYPGNVNWTEEGFRFAWRVMLVEKTGQVTFTVRDPASGRQWHVLPSQYLTVQQDKQMSFQPDMIIQFAHFLAAQYSQPVEVRAEVYVSWNGRPSRLLLDPAQNLLAIAPDWRPKSFILAP
ncbi:MAG: HTTM domain-containing protein [Anaerolineaceae bacterium]|nr:HTTM domain-containing protein [Anaerolineaceae bacterium]